MIDTTGKVAAACGVQAFGAAASNAAPVLPKTLPNSGPDVPSQPFTVEGTGGISYYLGTGNPVSLAPFLDQFKTALAETYVATFPVDANKKLVSLKLSTSVPKAKLRGPDQIRPGTIVLAQ